MTPYELEVREPAADGSAVVGLSGELDLTNAAHAERRLDEAAGENALILDLNGVTFIDSAALHMLFRLARRKGDAQRLGIVLERAAPVARTFEIVGIDAVTTVRPTIGELVGEPAS